MKMKEWKFSTTKYHNMSIKTTLRDGRLQLKTGKKWEENEEFARNFDEREMKGVLYFKKFWHHKDYTQWTPSLRKKIRESAPGSAQAQKLEMR